MKRVFPNEVTVKLVKRVPDQSRTEEISKSNQTVAEIQHNQMNKAYEFAKLTARAQQRDEECDLLEVL